MRIETIRMSSTSHHVTGGRRSNSEKRWSSSLGFMVRAAKILPQSLPRASGESVLKARRESKGIGNPYDVNHLRDIVDADDVGSAEDRSGDGRCRGPITVF